MNFKVSSGASRIMCLLRRDLSEVSVKETFLFPRRDGSMLRHVPQSGEHLIYSIIDYKMTFRFCSGPGAGKLCVFPFKFNAQTAYGCKITYHFKKV